MRTLALVVLLIAGATSVARAEGLLVLRVTVEVQGSVAANVRDANVSGEWLQSWRNGERRDVTLQPVDDNGMRSGPPRTFKACSLRETSGTDGRGSNVVETLRLACAS